jgi:2-oxoglutarate dehydrogenase E2 component (dihydrolipoamide succinyltransferase)
MDVTMPQLGETVTEGTLTRWLREPGASVTEGEPLFEVSTDKVDTEIPAPASGTLSEILVAVDTTVPVGARLAVISNGSAAAAAPAPKRTRHRASPLMRKLLAEHGIEPDSVTATGPDGKLTRADIDAAIAAPVAQGEPAAPTRPRPAAGPTMPAEPPVPDAPATTSPPERRSVVAAGTTVVPFTSIRRRTAEHMVRSKAVAPHTLMAIEVDFASVDAVRRKPLTYLPFVARAVIDAIADFPHVNASVGDNELLVHSAVQLGIAVDLDADGLVVPVIHGAADLRLAALGREIATLAQRARSGRLGADDLAGGTFTISNPGPYGTLLTGAIINQPQVAILATDAVRPRPVAVPLPGGGHGVTVHPVGNLALSFDHRAIDGGYAARFLARTKETLESRDWAAEL